MKISAFTPLSFSGDLIYKDRYIPEKQDQTHDIIRAHLEDKFGPHIFYYDQLQKEKNMNFLPCFYYYTKLPSRTRTKQEVDLELAKKAGIYSFSERRKNELYTGAELSCEPEKLKKLKEAGINSVISLVVYGGYEENARKAGLKFTDIFDLANSGLNVFDIRDNLIKQLIRHPEYYADDDVKGKIAGLKEFVNILNGKSVQFPPPVYFGCQWGTDRTFMWYQLYLILKDAPQDKPLSEDVIQKLVKYSQDVEETFRW